jgi:mannan endo-1,6-alpha-mannosidase
MSFYHGDEPGNIPGLLPGPPPDPTVIDGRYFWWEAGAMFGTMLDYWYYTGDETYNDVTYQALQFQVGEDKDYNPKNQSNGMGNDDQAFWGMAAMTAAEFGFRDPPPDQPQWLALAQAVFNTQQRRIMPADAPCGAGLRWQVFSNLNGFQYMNSISNGCFINIAARLAAYTKNDTYAQNAAAIWDWMEDRGFIDEQMNVYDGGHIQNGCKDINLVQFSYNAGVMLLASATMYNYVSCPSRRGTLSHAEAEAKTTSDQRLLSLARPHGPPSQQDNQRLLPRRHLRGGRV